MARGNEGGLFIAFISCGGGLVLQVMGEWLLCLNSTGQQVT